MLDGWVDGFVYVYEKMICQELDCRFWILDLFALPYCNYYYYYIPTYIYPWIPT